MVRARGGLRTTVAALVALAVPVALAQPADAGPGGAGRGQEQRTPSLTVMSYNLYLGSPLTPALRPDVDTPQEFVQAVATIYGTAISTDFPTRAAAIADIVAAEEPDLIGLQEVTDWVAAATRPGPAPVSQDFLAILLAELAERGLDYEVASVAQNASIGPAPLVAPTFGCTAVTDCTITLNDRDVILANRDTPALHWEDPRSGRYESQQVFTPPVGGEVSFARGWASVEVKYRGERFRFVDTHLEVADSPVVQEAQAREFLAGPASTDEAVVAVGDFNSAADGSTTETYGILTGVLDDAWDVNPDQDGYTSGQNGTLSNVVSSLRQRIDLVLTRSSERTSIRTLEAHVVGDQRFRDAPPPLWPSDHAGVVATLALR